MTVVIFLLSILFPLTVSVTLRLWRIQAELQVMHVVDQATHRLAHQFRLDAHAALHVENRRDGDRDSLVFMTGDEVRIEYEALDRRIARRVYAEGRIVHRDTFALGDRLTATLKTLEELDRPAARLQVDQVRGGSGILLRVDAVLNEKPRTFHGPAIPTDPADSNP